MKNKPEQKRHQLIEIITILPSHFQEYLKGLLNPALDSGDFQELYCSIGNAIQQAIESGCLGRREFLQLVGLVGSNGFLELFFPQSAHAGGIMPFGFWGAGARRVGSLDAYSPYRSLYLNGEGSIGALNAFLDSSTNNFTITKNGSPIQGTFSPFSTEAGKWSASFDGNGDCLQFANSNALNLSGGAFTIECWINPVGNYSNYNVIIAKRVSGATSTAWELYLDITTGKLSYYNGTNYVSTAVPALGSWSHVAAIYDGTSINLYLNGSRVLQSKVGNTEVSAPVTIGYANFGTEYFNGTISNLRIIKGTALYSGTSFSVPTSPLTAISGTQLLTLQDNRFIDNSGNNAVLTAYGDAKVVPMGPFSISSNTYSPAIHGGSAYFVGGTDSMTTPSNAGFGFGTGDFTIEGWIYWTGGNGENTFFCVDATGGANIFLTINGYWGIGGRNAPIHNNFSSSPGKNQWNHLAVARQSGTIRAFINGNLVYSGSNTNSYVSGSANLAIISTATGNNFTGYLSSVRVVNGTSIYTSSFTPPSAPLTAVTNSALLMNFTNADMIDDSRNNNLVLNGTLAQGTFSPFSAESGKWGIYFDGNGDYLQVANSTALTLTGGSYTIECWINPVGNYSNYNVIIAKRVSGTGSTAWEVYLEITTGKLAYYNGANYVSAAVPNPNTWNHIAAVYDGTSMNLYLNGSRVLQTALGNSDVSAPITIGYANYGTEYFMGFLSNLRVVKGSALYSGASFTVPTSPLTAVSGTQLLTLQDYQIRDNSTNNATFTLYGDTKVFPTSPFSPATTKYNSSIQGGSVYFNGSSYLSYTAATVTQAADFTFECWAYLNAVGSYDGSLFDARNANGSASGFDINVRSGSNVLRFYYSTTGVDSVRAVPMNQWVHLAVTRQSNTVRLFINGILDTTTATVTNSFTDNRVMIGAGVYSSSNITGFLSNLSFTVGTARYTSSFTPSMTPIAATSYSRLLLNCTNASIIDATRKNNFLRIGDSTISQSLKKFGSGSLYFDGNGDSLESVNIPDFNLGTGDFTIEFWVYLPGNQPGSFGGILDTRSSAGSYPWLVAIRNDNRVYLDFGSSWINVNNTALSLNTWHHIAIVRLSSTVKTYLNGTLDSSALTCTNNLTPTGTKTLVGRLIDPYYFYGYLDNITVIRGKALYTANFTPANITGY